jgi:hypothetical protein
MLELGSCIIGWRLGGNSGAWCFSVHLMVFLASTGGWGAGGLYHPLLDSTAWMYEVHPYNKNMSK